MSTAASPRSARSNRTVRPERPARRPLTAVVAAVTSIVLAIAGVTLTSVAANAAPGDVTGGNVTWGLSDYLNSSNMGRPNPAPGHYVAPASFDADSRLSTWGDGSGSLESDGSASLSFEGTSVNFAPTGGAWLTLTGLQAELDADGNGVVSAVVSYGLAPGSYPNIVFDPEQAPTRGPERVNMVLLSGNSVPAVQNADSVVWAGLAGLWHDDFLAFLAGDGDTIEAWAYASTVDNTIAGREPSPLSLELDLEPEAAITPVTYDTGAAVWGLSTYLNSSNMGRPNPAPGHYVAPASFDAGSRLSTWGDGSGSLTADGSASLAFQGTSVNFAPTGGAWLTLADLQADLDADGNGVVSAVVSYGLAPGTYPNIVFDPEQAPTRGPERIAVVGLAGNSSPVVTSENSATWTGLAGLWHDDFLAFLAGDGDTVEAWAYASTVDNAIAGREPSPFTLEVGIAPPAAVTPDVALTATPASGATQGTSVALSATVSPAAAGTIEFRNGTTVLGTATVDAASGIATRTVSTLPIGVHSLSATFTPTDTVAYTSATSPSVTFEVFAKVTASPGYLSWGVKSAFRAYITGPIAHGTVTVGGGAGAVGGAYRFPQSTGGSFNATTGLGSANYRGSVAFSGHSGALALTVSSPIVRVTSASTGALSVIASGMGRIDIATLNLAAAGRSVDSTGAVTYTNVPARLTSAGASAFSGYYSAGEALDPVSFVLGSASSASFASSTTGNIDDDGEFTPPATPPANTGLELVGDGEELREGGQVTVTGDGFESNEQNIHVVIYSDPIVLERNVTANASGVATWTGRLPAGITGQHTLTLQGSNLSRGIVLNIAENAVIEGCPVVGATLTWGVKDTFLAYIDGSIADGEWTVSDGATYETPLFSWANGTGTYDPDAAAGQISYSGSIRFTGHDGLLDTVLANPTLQFVDATTAYLLLDVTNLEMEDALEGLTENRATTLAVPFVKLTLTGAVEVSDDGTSLIGTDVATELTPEGNAVFSNYDAGTAFDALSFTAELGGDCADAAPVTEEPEAPVTETDATDLTWLFWVGGGVLAAAVLAGLVLLLRRRQ